MKTFAKPAMLAAALMLGAAPALAAAPANPAASLSVAKSVRASTATSRDSQLAGLGGSTITFVVIGAIVILAVVLIANNDTPNSV